MSGTSNFFGPSYFETTLLNVIVWVILKLGICHAGQTVDFLAPIANSVKVTSCARNDSYDLLGPRIQNVEAFWNKIEIKIIYIL